MRRIPGGSGGIVVVLAVVVAAALLLAFSPQSDGAAKVSGDRAARTIHVDDHATRGRTDQQVVQAAIDTAQRGDTVVFGPETYDLDAPIRLTSRVNYVGTPGSTTVGSTTARGLNIEHTVRQPLRDVTISGITFDNIRLTFTGNHMRRSFVDITLKDNVFRNGAESPEWLNPYLSFRYTDGVTVDGCQFLRSKGHGGRGVFAYRSHQTVIKDSFFGTTPALEAGTPNGYFRTAINIAGYNPDTGGNRETVVDGNVWRRTPGAATPAACVYCQDHGLYAWGTERLFVLDNTADGWDATAAGGSMKLRNMEDTFVVDNWLKTSGILTYVYEREGVPNHLRRVLIRDNVINLAGASKSCGAYCGISYWRDFDPNTGHTEEDVAILGNSFLAGGEITVSRGDGRAFCVEDNPDALLDFLVPDVGTAKCLSSVGWDEPLGGVHRGDFNGDGVEDFVHVVDDDGEATWRAHLSDEAGFDVAESDARVYESPQTTIFGVHVGDFNGDGRDDLTYSGYCEGRKPCLRTYLGTETGLAAPRDWGHDVNSSAETALHGVHVGDFNGDDRDDLVFRARCGEQDSCWRILFSTGERFSAVNGGAGARMAANTRAGFGLLVGDFTGDGRDDLAYRDACTSAGTPCFRILRGSASGFTAENWGDSTYFAEAGDTAHFGMRVGDHNDDGRADLAYLGKCGDAGRVHWRYHLSNGHGFTVRCSTEYRLAPLR